MYGKIFDSIYDGTLVEDWMALITFQQMVILCDSEGVIDMTPHAISRRTGIPIEYIESGIRSLEAKDPYSRSSDEDGRRILRLENSRDWGWKVVNHNIYRNIRNADDRREYKRKKQQEYRERDKINSNKNNDVVDKKVHESTRKSTSVYVSVLDNKKNRKKKSKKFIPPSEQEVIQYFLDNGFSKALGKKAFDYYKEGSWKDSSGKQVKNWKQKMQGVWFKDENRTDEYDPFKGAL